MLPLMPTLFSWPLFAMGFFSKMSPAHALSWTIIAGYLFLPRSVQFNLPILPPVTKETMPAFAALLAVMMFVRGRDIPGALPGILPKSRVITALLILSIVSPILTTLTNMDGLRYGVTRLPALGFLDIASGVQKALILLIPVLLARKYLATSAAHQVLLTVLCILASFYGVLALYEIILSPQLNVKVYGFFPSTWAQHVRSGGYRPVVFLAHGLWLAIFFTCAVLGALGLLKVIDSKYKPYVLTAAVFLFAIQVLSNSFGSMLLTFALAPFVFFFKARTQLLIAATLCAAVLTFPILRGSGFVPTDQLVSTVRSIDNTRAASLQYRFNNEDILYDKFEQRPLGGWGGWSRARVFNEAGRDISTTDGYWIIILGTKGWAGYLATFGLLAVPSIFLAFRQRRYDITYATSALSMMMAASLIDLVPNAGISNLTWIIAGALIGRLEVLKGDPSETTASQAPSGKTGREIKYSRTPPQHTRQRAIPTKTTRQRSIKMRTK